MLFNLGDYVTRNSYKNDIVFRIIKLDGDIALLSGVNVRLVADSNISDLNKCGDCEDDFTCEDRDILEAVEGDFSLDRDNYFYLPGKVLHIDSDKGYLNRCIDFYKKVNIPCFGIVNKENKIYLHIKEYLDDIKPDVLVITGHDAFFDKDDNYDDDKNYKNSLNFIRAVREARNYENDHEKLIIIAGACQSNYEELIRSGSNFASSPRRVNIHALDPAIVAASICLSDRNKPIDLLKIIERTKYGKDGIGGIITKGAMFVGYPR